MNSFGPKITILVEHRNTSFCKLGEEECEFCLMHSQHKCEITDQMSCEECMQIMAHKNLVERTRRLYSEDKEKPQSSDYSFKSVDLQKFLMMPRLPGVKTAVFTRRLVVFHETFVPLKTR